ncbi:hypothetical protein [Riemerella columbina]|uniref:hypothetical protein n=1 Tax=Riemerella columbina TaxID=103810 RepID=UPI00037BB7DB|nr:hypothetical protein [Riemerella columbina]
MTTAEKLQAITADIREKLPRMMELEEGCILKYPIFNRAKTEIISDYEAKIINVFGGGQIADTGDYDDLECFMYSDDSWVERKNLTEDNYEVIGKEPMLTDVLEWVYKVSDLASKSKELQVSFDGYFCVYDHAWEKVEICKICWDLSKPYLKDQSEEVIDFLYQFVK